MKTAIKIDQPIVCYEIAKSPGKGVSQTAEVSDREQPAPPPPTPVKAQRPDGLRGATYKVKPATSEHALYITINDLDGKPFEIFISSKSMDHFQWVTALTRTLSALMRQGGDITFLLEELACVHDPRGGYFKKGRWMPSIVAEIGDVLHRHLADLGLAAQIQPRQAHPHQAQQQRVGKLCPKCQQPAMVTLDGCDVCTSCGESKCC
jgi:hypothetical protein